MEHIGETSSISSWKCLQLSFWKLQWRRRDKKRHLWVPQIWITLGTYYCWYLCRLREGTSCHHVVLSTFFSGSCRGFSVHCFSSREWEFFRSWAVKVPLSLLVKGAGDSEVQLEPERLVVLQNPWKFSRHGVTIQRYSRCVFYHVLSDKSQSDRWSHLAISCHRPLWDVSLCPGSQRDLNLRPILVDEVSKRWWKSGVVHLPGLGMFMVFSCGSWTHPPTKKYYILV